MCYDSGGGYDGGCGYDRGSGYDGGFGYDIGSGYDGAGGCFFFFIPNVYRGLVSSVITIDNKITIKNFRMHQSRTLSYLLFAYTVSEDLIRGNEVLQLFLEF